jgi:hypothetical protein
MKAPKAPAPLDVGRVQAAQNQQNQQNAADQARYNRINQYGPYGSVTYDPTTGAQTTSLNADEMAMRNQGRDTWGQAAGGLAGVAGQTPGTLARTLNDPEGLAQQGAGRLRSEFAGPGQDSNGAFDRAYEYASANLEPRMERQRAAMENRLRNQGLDPTSEAYRTASNDLALQQNEARNNLVTGLQGQMFNQGLQGRQQGFNEATGLMGLGMQRAGQAFGQDQAIANVRNQGLGLQGDLYGRLGQMGLSGMGGAAQSPGAAGYQGINVGNVDVTGLEGRRQTDLQNQYNQEVAQRNAMIGGIAGIGGSILAAPMKGGGSLGGWLGSRALGG